MIKKALIALAATASLVALPTAAEARHRSVVTYGVGYGSPYYGSGYGSYYGRGYSNYGSYGSPYGGYYNCGGTYYQPQYSGADVTYVVVNNPE